MKITGYEYRHDGTARLSVELASKREAAALEAALSGARWARGGADGGLVIHPRFPEPVLEPDPVIGPHFPPTTRQSTYLPYDDTPDPRPWDQPPVYAQHLCGYEFMPENYRRAAAWMESAGFACLRSRRGPDGKYWELWYLPGPWAARGPIGGMKTSREVAEAVCHHARPGAVTFGAAGGFYQRID